MAKRFIPTALTMGIVSALSLSTLSQAHAESILDYIIDTTPAGLVETTNGSHQWSDLLDGSKKIMEEGKTMWIVPTYTNHPRWAWDNRRQQNAHPFGMGLGRTVIDGRGNERSLFFVTFVDSNYRIEPTMGYQWLARFPIGNTGFHWGAGYLAGTTIRGDYRWIPLPMFLPVAKVGTDTVSLYMTYIPFTDVMFMYSTITIDDTKSRKAPLPATSPWSKAQNFVYGGIGWKYVDNSNTEDTVTMADNDKSWNVGLRHYSGRNWATDLSYRRSKHLVRLPDRQDTYKFESYALQIQYNIDATDDLRLYAGGGFGYSIMKGQGKRAHSLHPVTSLGATYAITNNIFVNADMRVSFSRFKDSVEGSPDEYFKAIPTDFSLSVGYAF